MQLFHWFSRFTLFVGLVLIWWGAAVTTEDVGLAVPDWPLAFGKVNPEGWMKVPALFLEHGHRWIATGVGLLVLVMYFWRYAKECPREELSRIRSGWFVVFCAIGLSFFSKPIEWLLVKILILVALAPEDFTWELRIAALLVQALIPLVLALFLGLFEPAAFIFIGSCLLFLVFKGYLIPASIIVFIGLVWLVLTWIAKKWSLLRGLTVLALFTVIGQASLGGLRVLKMSDPYGISHGTLGQLFFCLLVFIAFASSKTWHGESLVIQKGRGSARVLSMILFMAVFGQLVIGATLRHTQRLYLAANDILTTKGQLFPPMDPADVFVLHLHKYWGFTVALLVLAVAWKSRIWLGRVPRLRWISPALMIMPINQVVLGIYVVLTGKSFWVTNLHVLNGLGLLVLTFLLAVSVWASTAGLGLNGQTKADKPLSPA